MEKGKFESLSLDNMQHKIRADLSEKEKQAIMEMVKKLPKDNSDDFLDEELKTHAIIHSESLLDDNNVFINPDKNSFKEQKIYIEQLQAQSSVFHDMSAYFKELSKELLKGEEIEKVIEQTISKKEEIKTKIHSCLSNIKNNIYSQTTSSSEEVAVSSLKRLAKQYDKLDTDLEKLSLEKYEDFLFYEKLSDNYKKEADKIDNSINNLNPLNN